MCRYVSATNPLCVPPPATEEISCPLARRKGGKGGADTAARKGKSRIGEGISKSKRVKQSEGVHESCKRGKRKGCYHREEDPASSDQFSASSEEGQSSTSSEEGEDQCREREDTYCR